MENETNKLLKSIDKNIRFFVYLTAISLVIGGIAVITILCKPFFDQFQ